MKILRGLNAEIARRWGIRLSDIRYHLKKRDCVNTSKALTFDYDKYDRIKIEVLKDMIATCSAELKNVNRF